MIDIEQEETQAQEQERWFQLWERPSGVARCGIEGKFAHNLKYYRAWAAVMLGDEERRLESPEYEACDAADVDESRRSRGFIIPEVRDREERAIRDAEIARALMSEKQRSPKDMQAIAHALAEQLTRESEEYDLQMRHTAQQRAYDEAALEVARPLVHGLRLLLEHGSDEEKQTLRSLFGRK